MRRRHRSSGLRGSFLCFSALSLCCLLAGCASTGTPLAPSLMLPQPVKGLQAQRAGNHVDLHWTTPTLTTDRTPLVARRHGAGTLTAEICRVEGTGCTVFTRQTVIAGEMASARQVLDAASASGPPRALRYRVRVLNGAGRGAGWSQDALAVGGEAPAPIAALAAATTAQGMQLTWLGASATPGDRILLRAVSPNLSERDLMAPAGAGGTVDTGATTGVPVRYTVVRTRDVQVEGTTLTLNGEAADITVTLRKDIFPPSAPRGLVAVAVQMEGAPPEIDLSWEPNSEPDVAGYLVFRSEGGTATVSLTPSPVTSVSFRDGNVTAGRSYRYTVAAVDRAGNRGTASAPAEERLR